MIPTLLLIAIVTTTAFLVGVAIGASVERHTWDPPHLVLCIDNPPTATVLYDIDQDGGI